MCFFFFQAEDGIRDDLVTGVQTCALPIWHRRQLARLVGVSEDDLARLEAALLRVGGGPAAALDRRLADPVLEAEGCPPGRKLVAVLPPDQLDAGELLVGAA